MLVEKKTGCIAQAMDILGNKWTALIIRDLCASPLRYCQLEKSIVNINPRILSKRLKLLEDEGIIQKKFLKDTNSHQYCLTQKGVDLVPILKKMSEWGEKYFKD